MKVKAWLVLTNNLHEFVPFLHGVYFNDNNNPKHFDFVYPVFTRKKYAMEFVKSKGERLGNHMVVKVEMEYKKIKAQIPQ